MDKVKIGWHRKTQSNNKITKKIEKTQGIAYRYKGPCKAVEISWDCKIVPKIIMIG